MYISRTFLLMLFLSCSFTGFSQVIQRASTGMAGSSGRVDQFYFSQSIGQAGITGTYSSKGRVLRQGFQQPPVNVAFESGKEEIQGLIIYPNPTEQWLNIQFGIPDDVEISITDGSGRQVYTKQHNAQTVVRIDVSTYPSGLYMIRIESKGQLKISSIIKL